MCALFKHYLYWLVLGRDDRLRCDELLLQEFRLCSASGCPITSSPITTGFGLDFNNDLLLTDSLLFFTCSRLPANIVSIFVTLPKYIVVKIPETTFLGLPISRTIQIQLIGMQNLIPTFYLAFAENQPNHQYRSETVSITISNY